MPTYHEEQNIKSTLRLRNLLLDLPPFVADYFRGIAHSTSARTRTEYAYDLRIFFDYLCHLGRFQGMKPQELTLEHLKTVSPDDLEMFLDHITYYEKVTPEKTVIIKNDERGKARKLAAIRSMLQYFYRKRKIPSNPADLVDQPKIHGKNIVRLETDEVIKLLEEVEKGTHLTSVQKRFHEYTKLRDLAIMTLLLGTGLRVSECVGINISDIDFKNQCIRIVRKGGNESMIYFGEEVMEALQNYYEQRKTRRPLEGHEDAFFLSMRDGRITVRAIQNLVKKYSSLVTTMKKISPHKLRSTYGTSLYKETGDIYLVADVLGHQDVNTTKKYYAQIEEERRKSAASHVVWRKK